MGTKKNTDTKDLSGMQEAFQGIGQALGNIEGLVPGLGDTLGQAKELIGNADMSEAQKQDLLGQVAKVGSSLGAVMPDVGDAKKTAEGFAEKLKGGKK